MESTNQAANQSFDAVTKQYVVEWFGVLYGPFRSEQAAAMFAARSPVPTENPMARGVVRTLKL